jgi:hypothetical protein
MARVQAKCPPTLAALEADLDLQDVIVLSEMTFAPLQRPWLLARLAKPSTQKRLPKEPFFVAA